MQPTTFAYGPGVDTKSRPSCPVKLDLQWRTIFALIASVLVVGCALPGGARHGAVCAVHGVPLRAGVAPVEYGHLSYPPGYDDDRRLHFPNSGAYVLGGSVAGAEQTAVVAYCPKCRALEPPRPVRVNAPPPKGNRQLPLIAMDVRFVQFPASDLAAVMPPGSTNTDAIIPLARAGKATVLHRFQLSSQPGLEAHAEDVNLVTYPAQFSAAGASGPGARSTASRQVGADIGALPTFEAGGKLLNVCLAANLVQISEWRTNRISVLDGTNVVELVAAQPVFHKLALDTCVRVPPGDTVVVGGPLGGGGDAAVFVLLSARLAEVADPGLTNALAAPASASASQP